MGYAKLEWSSRCETQTARLSSIEKENGGCATREMGEGQAREEGSLET
jgi:hypothetical protein